MAQYFYKEAKWRIYIELLYNWCFKKDVLLIVVLFRSTGCHLRILGIWFAACHHYHRSMLSESKVTSFLSSLRTTLTDGIRSSVRSSFSINKFENDGCFCGYSDGKKCRNTFVLIYMFQKVTYLSLAKINR